MRLTFLGTSAGLPTRERNLACVALRLDDGRVWLVDCGEATQHRMLDADLHPGRIERVLLTHLHGDHCWGLPGLLASMGLQGRTDPLEVTGPAGVRAWLDATFRASHTHLPYPLALRELPARGGPVADAGVWSIRALPLVHRVTSFAYLVREAPRRGRFDAARAEALGVPGPLRGALVEGRAVALPDGRRVEPREVLGPPRPGRVVVVCGDSADSRVLRDAARGCDVLVHECTFDASRAEQARLSGHSTSADVATLAAALQPRRLVLTHLSPRYTSRHAALGPEDLRRQVEARCPGVPVVMARDGLSLEVPPRAT